MWRLSNSLKHSKNRILEFRLEGYYESNDISGIDYANAVYSCMTAYSTSFVKDIYGEKDRYDYIVLNTGNIVVVDSLVLDSLKTKDALAMLKSLSLEGKILFVASEDAENLYMATRNLGNVLVLFADEINVYDIINADVLVLDEASLKQIEEVLK